YLVDNINNGREPYGSLVSDGTYLYGMTKEGGEGVTNTATTSKYGVIFKIKPDGTDFTKLLDFNFANGGRPQGSLISDGTYLYGTTSMGGTGNFLSGSGSIFKIKPDGTEHSILSNFGGDYTTNNIGAYGLQPLGS